MEGESPKTIRAREVLDEAALTMSQRGEVYGAAYLNHRRIADLWTAYLDTPITPDQVAICMVLTKISRLTETVGHRNRDSYVDIAAYTAISAECATWDPYAD